MGSEYVLGEVGIYAIPALTCSNFVKVGIPKPSADSGIVREVRLVPTVGILVYIILVDSTEIK